MKLLITEVTAKRIDDRHHYPGRRGEEGVEQSKSLALREAKRIRDSAFDKIWKYYYEPKKNIELSEHEEEIRLRLNNVWQLITGRVLNDRKAVLAHTQWCKDNYMQISERTAYDDLRRTKFLFGDPRQNMATFEKARISSILLDLIETAKSTVEKCTAMGEYELAAKHNDSAARLIRRYNAVNGIEQDPKTQLPRPPIVINFNADKETLMQQAAELMKGIAVDTDYEEAD